MLPAQLINTSLADTSNSDSVSGTNVISSNEADTACNALISVPKMRAATPKAFMTRFCTRQWLIMVSPIDMPLSRAAMPLDAAVINTSVLSGPPALPRQMS